jgi:glycosyltransferase involved in cell wall biosynthesis
MITKPLVSVVIPAFNSEKYIKDCIRSVLQQTYSNIEIIVVDDGSTDGTQSKLQELSKEIIILRKENEGAASARNMGILYSSGIYVALLDSDDIWLPEKLDKQVQLMSDKELDLVYCGGESFGHTGAPTTYTPEFSGDCYKNFVQFPTRAIIVLGCSSAIIRKSVLEHSGNFDANFLGSAEDWDFFRRFCKHGKVGFLDEALVKYRLHDKNVSGRGVIDFYRGNRKALTKMFAEDKVIGTLERVQIILKFEVIMLKFCVKKYVIGEINQVFNYISGHFKIKWFQD